jgi:hypothetical protein
VAEIRLKPADARAKYVRDYRRAHPEYRARNNSMARARKRAQEALARQYPDDYRRLYRDELRKLHDAGLLD